MSFKSIIKNFGKRKAFIFFKKYHTKSYPRKNILEICKTYQKTELAFLMNTMWGIENANKC